MTALPVPPEPRPAYPRRPLTVADYLALPEDPGNRTELQEGMVVLDAGIDHYRMVELDGRPTLAACHRAGEFGYADADPVQGTFTTEFPFLVRIDLDGLR